MGYIDYTGKFDNPTGQHNIMAIVGNGFDIQALNSLGVSSDTRYTSFYYFLKSRNFDPSNLIFQEMSKLEQQNIAHPGTAQNWSDVEQAINTLHANHTSITDITRAMDAIQAEFSNFLDQVVTPSVLTDLSRRTVADRLTLSSLMEFLGDIEDDGEYGKMALPARCTIGDIFNFQFINLNYTSLLDNFLYLDKTQFVPRPYKGSDRQVSFHPNPRGHTGKLKGKSVNGYRTAPEAAAFTGVGYLTTSIIHPHGTQGTPRSLLFGIDSTTKSGRTLSKPYWAQNEIKYADLFGETNVFIIFGSSLGETDRWWWESILKTLDKDEAERPDILLYWFTPSVTTNSDTADDIRSKLISAAGLTATIDLTQRVAEHVRVIFYDGSTHRAWLNTTPALKPHWLSSANR